MRISFSQYQMVLVTYLRPLWRQAGLLAFLLFSGTGLRLVSPLILAAFIDTAVGGGTLTRLFPLALIFLGLAVVRQFMTVGESYLATSIGLSATNRLRADLTLHCLRLDMSFHNQRTPGELIERVDGDVGQLNNFLSRFAVEVIGSLLLLLGVLVALFLIDARVGAALTIFALVTLLVMNSLRHVAVPHFRALRQAQAALFGFLEERLSGTEDVRSSGAGAYVMHLFFERARELLRKQLMANFVGTGTYSVTTVLFALGSILSLGVGAWLFGLGAITIGTVYLIFRYAELLTQPIESLNRQIQDLQQAGAAMIRIQDLLTTESRLRDTGEKTLPSGALSVSFERVTFRYGEGESVLKDISLSLAPGAVLGLLGRTGSGKTTLTRLLFRFYEPSEGTVRLSGIPLPELQLEALRQGVGLVTQEIQLFHASVRDNLTLFDPSIPDEKIHAVLKDLGLASWLEGLGQGLDTQLAPGGSGLSAGEAQLLAFVRVFLKDPGLVILDEASSRLDLATEALLEKAIDRLLTGRTAIIIAHRLATVGRADSIMILEEGEVVEYGERERLAKDSHSRFAELLRTGLEAAA